MKSLKLTVVLPLLAATAGGQALQSPSVMHINKAGDQIQLTWQGENLRPYQIEAGSDLLTWAEIGPMFVGTGNPLGYTHTNSAPRHFYRLREGAMRPGFDEVEFERNDDLTYPSTYDNPLPAELVPIGFTINFFGSTWSSCYVNNNGNITFQGPLPTYTPKPLGAQQTQIIAPFWADVDTRHPISGITRFTGQSEFANGRPAFGVTWKGVGYFSWEIDKNNSFQLVLIERSDRASGDFDIEFNYNQIQWETGSMSGGVLGLGGFPARVGVGNGTGGYIEYNGSGESLAFLDETQDSPPAPNYLTGLRYQMSNSTVPGRIVIPVRNGIPDGIPPFQVNAGNDVELSPESGAQVYLNGIVTPSTSDLTYEWVLDSPPQTDEFPLVAISNPSQLSTSVTLLEPAEYTFRLIASKQVGAFVQSSTDTVTINHLGNFYVDGGSYYLESTGGASIILSDAYAEFNNSTVANVAWTQTYGQQATIGDTTNLHPTVTLPGPGFYIFEITATTSHSVPFVKKGTAYVTYPEITL